MNITKFICTYFVDGKLKSSMVQAHDLVHASRIVQRVLRVPALAILSITGVGKYTGPASPVITDNRQRREEKRTRDG